MAKRISCRVISSAVFSKTSLREPSVKQPNDRQHEIGDTVTVTVKPGTIINPMRNADILSVASGTSDFPIGQIFDCYA